MPEREAGAVKPEKPRSEGTGSGPVSAALPPDDEREVRIRGELAALQKTVEQTVLEATDEISRLQREAETARLDAEEKIAAVQARTDAAIRQTRAAADRLAQEEEDTLTIPSSPRRQRFSARAQRPLTEEESTYMYRSGSVGDSYARLIDTIASLSRSYALALVDSVGMVADAVGTCSDTTSTRSRDRLAQEERIGTVSGRFGGPSGSRYSERRRVGQRGSWGRQGALVGDISAGWMDAIGELVDVPGRTFDSFYANYNQMQRR